jgi:hypothetical protein
MRHYPGQWEAVQTTSNVKDREALIAWRQRSLDDQNRAIATLRAAFNQRMAGLLIADAAKTAAAVIKKYTTAWDQSLVNTLGEPQEMQQTKRRLRVSAHEALRGEPATVPTLGYLLNDITWRDNNTFGELYNPNTAVSDVALGINFQAPQTGFLHVACVCGTCSTA